MAIVQTFSFSQWELGAPSPQSGSKLSKYLFWKGSVSTDAMSISQMESSSVGERVNRARLYHTRGASSQGQDKEESRKHAGSFRVHWFIQKSLISTNPLPGAEAEALGEGDTSPVSKYIPRLWILLDKIDRYIEREWQYSVIRVFIRRCTGTCRAVLTCVPVTRSTS